MDKNFENKINYDEFMRNVEIAYNELGEASKMVNVLNEYCKINIENEHVWNISGVITSLSRTLEYCEFKLHKIVDPESNDSTPEFITRFNEYDVTFEDNL